MYILNKFGVMHTIPDDMPLPAGARRATEKEIAAWQAEDATNKAAIRAQKEASRLAHAQTVVTINASDVEPPTASVAPDADKGGAKKNDDAK